MTRDKLTYACLFGVLLTSACGPAPRASDTKDAALSVWEDHPGADRRDRVTVLYWIDGPSFYESLCPADRLIYDRATCRDRVRRVPLKDLYAAATPKFGGDMDVHQQKVRDLYVKIGQIDTKLLELEDQTPPPDPAGDAAALRARITAKEEDLALVDRQAVDTDDQIKRIEDQLAQGPDAALLARLGTLRTQRKDIGARQQTLLNDIGALRQQLIELRSSVLDRSTFDAMQQRRKAAVDQLHTERESLEFAERWKVALNRTLKFVAEQGFTYEYTDGTAIPPGPMDDEREVLRVLHDTFADVYSRVSLVTLDRDHQGRGCDRALGTCEVVGQIVVTGDAHFESMKCAIRGSTTDCDHISVVKLDDADPVVMDTARGSSFLWTVWTSGSPIFDAQAKGRWGVHGVCGHQQPFQAYLECEARLRP